ncbi:MAG: hypothetical protein ACFE0I_02445 [Elainellaceae cyanobacterium]
MNVLARIGIGLVSGLATMGVILGTLEEQVSERRMLFIGAIVGTASATVPALIEVALEQKKPQSPIKALERQLNRKDLTPIEALKLAEQLATLRALPQTEEESKNV